MKLRSLPVKRQPIQKGILKRLSAVTRNQRRQRVSAATASSPEIEQDDGSSKISRALTIIFLFHILAIGLWFVHERFLDGYGGETAEATSPEEAPVPIASAAPVSAGARVPVLSNGDAIYVVRRGDNYAAIAANLGVHEADLRAANDHAEIYSGLILRVPPKRIVAVEPPELTALRAPAAPALMDEGLVDAEPMEAAPRAIVVRPNVARPTAAPAASGGTYVVKQGDSVWRIANRFGVDQNALMKANGISDPRKLRTGMTLSIPR